VIPRLHLVTDDVVLQQSSFIPTATRVLRALAPNVALHVRGRATSAQTLFGIVSELHGQGGIVLVNDRVDVAITARAHGVQLGARSLPIGAVREISHNLTIGYSAHEPEECARAGRDGADFVFAGSIYATASHPGVTPGGLPLLASCVAGCSVPVLAIGGVTHEQVAEVRAAGAHGVAVIRAVWHAPDPVQSAQQFAKLLEV
jgi:thiamine-phosphate diphosphorylase